MLSRIRAPEGARFGFAGRAEGLNGTEEGPTRRGPPALSTAHLPLILPSLSNCEI